MYNIYLSFQCSKKEVLVYSGQLDDTFNVISESELTNIDRPAIANGWANVYIMLDGTSNKGNSISYCGKEGSKSYKLAKIISDNLGNTELNGGGECYFEMNATTMNSVLINVGTDEISVGVDTFFGKIKKSLLEYFNVVVENKDENNNKENGKEDNKTTEDDSNITENKDRITNEQLGEALRIIFKALHE